MSREWTMTIMTILGIAAAVHAGAPATPETAARLGRAEAPVRVVCFGDSITGVYYHTGGRRAWPELLELALRKSFPNADLTVYNAGISGNTTDAGLKRIERDVLGRKPHAVVVMFGMNDLAYGTVDDEVDRSRKTRFRDNLESIAEQCRGAGAEVVLLTPNPVYPESMPRRPPGRVAEFAELVRALGAQLGVPVVDAHAEWMRIRGEQPRRWRVLMSETIHPSLAGHRLFAEMTASAMVGEPVSLSNIGPSQPYLPKSAALLDAQPGVVKIVVADALAAALTEAFRVVAADVGVDVVSWPVSGRSLDQLEAWAKRIRAIEGKVLVVGAFSPESAVIGEDEEAFVRQASWVVNHALPFGSRTWDVLFVSPDCFAAELTPAQREGAGLLREIVEAHDLLWLGAGETVAITDMDSLRRWVVEQLRQP